MRLSDFLHKGITLTRDSRKKLLVLTLLVGIGAFLINNLAGFISSGKKTTIVTVASDLQAGTVLQQSDLKDITITGAAPPNVLTSDKDAKGLALALPVRAGTPLVKSLVDKNPLRDGLYPGEVGVWIGVNLITSGLANPGDLVDIKVQYDQTKAMPTQSPQAFPELKGVRVVDVVNGSAQHTKGQTGGNNASVPAAVEVAVPESISTTLVNAAGTGKIVLVKDPFATPLTQNSTNSVNQPQGTANALMSPNTGTPVTPGTPGTNTSPNKNSSTSAAATSPIQNSSQQTKGELGTNNYVPPTFNPGNANNQGQ